MHVGAALVRVGLFGLILLSACEKPATAPVDEPDRVVPDAVRLDAGPLPSVSLAIEAFNEAQRASGSDLRLDPPWMFVVGPGTDPFGRLRMGNRWTTTDLTYILDASDFTSDLPAAEVEAALMAGFDAWNAVAPGGFGAARVADDGGNYDILDGTYDASGNCISIFDPTSPNIDVPSLQIFPAADVVAGGWLPPAYFAQCHGNPAALAITYTFSRSDTNGDGYRDIVYVEHYFNPTYTWVSSGSVELDSSSGVDLASVAVHEIGHGHGLDHFGGPRPQQPFVLNSEASPFHPVAVMNPFYRYGEKRDLMATDLAAFRSLYARGW